MSGRQAARFLIILSIEDAIVNGTRWVHTIPLDYRVQTAVEMVSVLMRFFDKAARIRTDLH